MEAAEGRKGELDAKVGELDRQIAGVQDDVAAAEQRLAALVGRQQATEARLEQARRELQEAKDALGRSAVAAYTGQTEAARWADLLLHSRTMGELATKRTYIRAAAGSQAELITTAERLRDEVQDLRNELDGARAQAQGQRDVVAGEQAKLQSGRAEQDAVRQEVGAQVADLDETRATRSSPAKRSSKPRPGPSSGTRPPSPRPCGPGSRAGAHRAGAHGGSNGSSGGGTSSGGSQPSSGPRRPGGLVSPIPGAPIVSGFGNRVHPVYGTVRMHTGVDLGASTGTAIRAAGSGVVVTAASMGGYGMATVIDHGGSLATLYGHQSSIGVSEGQEVTQGQVIGRVGCTGTCTGPHLHFEVRVNGSPVNPMGYL